MPSTETSGGPLFAAAITVQIMVEESSKIAATVGYGFGRFIEGKSEDKVKYDKRFLLPSKRRRTGSGVNAVRVLKY